MLFTLIFCQKTSVIFVLGYTDTDTNSEYTEPEPDPAKIHFLRIHVDPDFYPKLILHT
jgi:hypothetical protein